MSLAVVRSRALDGLSAPEVMVEVHLANGLPSFTLVGLADTEVKEARERVRAALTQSGFSFPHNKRITVNLAPADLPKESGRFDLPIALGILAAQDLLDTDLLARTEFAGELSLAGELRPIRGALPLALATRRAMPARTLILPQASAAQAARVPGVVVRSARHLVDVVQALMPTSANPQASGQGLGSLPLAAHPPESPLPDLPDLRDVRGQTQAKRALEVAASGGHSLLMVGPPGAGKSMLAQRLPGLLPPLNEEEALTSAALASVSPQGFDAALYGRRPFRAPHHSASAVALVGGGSPPKPGEISLAHGGVLFLDELPEFARSALEALREPLESGWVTISRAGRQAQFPAGFQLIAAMNPCPCGWLGASLGSGQRCRCTPDAVNRYQSRLSGPLLDRIDLLLDVPALAAAELLDLPATDDSASVAARVAQARQRQWQRQGRLNAQLDAAGLDAHCGQTPAARSLLEAAAQRLGWSGRSLHRVLKLARSIADLADAPQLDTPHIAEAIQYRRSLSGA